MNIPDYPDADRLVKDIKALKHALVLDTAALAKESGNPRNTNIVLLGAIANFLGLEPEIIEKAIREHFARKGDSVVDAALMAFRLGKDAK